MHNKFNDILKLHLKDTNLSALSREICISKTVLHDWVYSNRLPSMKNIHLVKKLADYLGLTLDELFFGTTTKKKVLSIIQFEDDGNKYKVLIEKE